MHNARRQRAMCSSGVNSVIAQAWNSLPAPKRGRKEFRLDELVFTEACAPLNGGQACAQTRESLSWIRMTRTGLITRESLRWIHMTRSVRQDARRSGKEDAGHSLFLGGCLFGFYGEHNSKIMKGSCRDVTWRGLVVTWRLIRDWSYLLTFRTIKKVSNDKPFNTKPLVRYNLKSHKTNSIPKQFVRNKVRHDT